jgi:hypothetical protein
LVPGSFANFFVATSSAGGALIGLLFVAVSINPDRTFGPTAPHERQSVAANAFTGLIVAFFVSTDALVPDSNVAGICLFMSALGIISSARLGIRLVRYQVRQRVRRSPLWVRLVRALTMVVGSLIIYGFLAFSGVSLLHQPSDRNALDAVATLVVVCYGLGLFRAWELLGGPRQGLSNWLNPLLDLDDARESAPTSAPPSGVPPQTEASTPVPMPAPRPDSPHR